MNFTKYITTSLVIIIAFGTPYLTGCDRDASQDADGGDSYAVSHEMSFESIFDGTSLAGWDGDPRFWSVENGMIVGETTEENPTESNTFLIWEEDEPADFEIRFDYQFVIVSDAEYGNSGIQIRSERFTDEENSDLIYRVRGYQPDFAISDWIPGIHYEEGLREILARRGQQVLIDSSGEQHQERFAEEDELGEYIDVTGWNEYHVYAHGDTIRTSINGQLMHEIIDESPEASHEGVVAFQLHSGPPMRVEFRNIELRYID